MKQIQNLLLRNTLVQAAVFVILTGVCSTENQHGIHSESKANQTFLRYFLHPQNGSFVEESTSLCDLITVKRGNFLILKNTSAYIPFYKKIFPPSSYHLNENTLFLCADKSTDPSLKSIDGVIDFQMNCEAWSYEPEEYRILNNGSVMIGDEIYYGRFKFFDEVLYTCYDDHGEEYNISIDRLFHDNKSYVESDSMTAVYIGNVGCVLSIIAITVYLIIFALIKELRTPPAYNLTSLNVTLLLGYLFFLVGQHQNVIGTFCVICAILNQYFFLAAFLWMNCLSFDLWRTLWTAITKLQISSTRRKIQKFVIYSLYSWGIALIFTIAAVIVDNHPDTPHDMRPAFGMNGICMFNGNEAKKIFFVIPGGILLAVNAIFFCHSTYLVLVNSMKDDDSNQTTAKRNFLLYVRLGVIMGVTWLLGIIGIFDSSVAISIVFNVLNSSQGLLMFLLFISSRKTWQQIRGRVKRKSLMHFFKNTSSGVCEYSSSSDKDSRALKENEVHEDIRRESNAA